MDKDMDICHLNVVSTFCIVNFYLFFHFIFSSVPGQSWSHFSGRTLQSSRCSRGSSCPPWSPSWGWRRPAGTCWWRPRGGECNHRDSACWSQPWWCWLTSGSWSSGHCRAEQGGQCSVQCSASIYTFITLAAQCRALMAVHHIVNSICRRFSDWIFSN